MSSKFIPRYSDRILKRIPVSYFGTKFQEKYIRQRDAHFLKELELFNPDLLFMQNCGGLLPETLYKIQKEYKNMTTRVHRSSNTPTDIFSDRFVVIAFDKLGSQFFSPNSSYFFFNGADTTRSSLVKLQGIFYFHFCPIFVLSLYFVFGWIGESN